MKTGRLLKFPRPRGDVHAYIYRDGASFSAAVYLLSPGRGGTEPVHSVSGPTEAAVEASVREWVDTHYPRSG
jgi:hypothetical protein